MLAEVRRTKATVEETTETFMATVVFVGIIDDKRRGIQLSEKTWDITLI